MKQSQLIKNLIWLLVLAFLMKGCKSLEPVRPEEKYLSSENEYKKRLSVINIPVEMDLMNLQKRINSEIQGLLFEDQTKEENSELHLKIWKKAPIEVTADGGSFNIKAPLKVWAKGGVSFSSFGVSFSDSKETTFELDLKFKTNISISEDWEIISRTVRNGFDWIKKPVVKLGPVNLPLASMLSGIIEAQQDVIAENLDKEIQPNLHVKPYVQEAWTLIQQPYLLSEDFDVWLKVTPIDILMTDLKGRGRHTGFTMGIKAYTETFVGEKPETVLIADLPQMELVDSVPSEFNIGLSSKISHEQIAELLRQHVLNQRFTFNKNKYEVTVTAIDLYGSDDYLVVEAGLKGSVNGVIYLKGKPKYDHLSQTLYLKDLDFDLDTKNKLIKTASWLAHGSIVDSFEEALTLPLGEQIESAAAAIKQNIENVELAPGVFIKGRLNELAPSEVFITSESVIATIVATGQADLKIEDFQY